ncbi:FabD/lysophospholipase-like protein [Cenococcum geophilum]
MPEHDFRLLALDGGGVRGLSTLQIVKQLMDTIDPESPPKPCDYFDMIGGTSTGGLIAIMLGRLRMTVDECIDAYVSPSDRIFQKRRHCVTIKGQVQRRFDSDELQRAIKEIVARQGLAEDALLKDAPDAKCKVFVCATSSETGDTVRLTSYRSPRGRERLLRTAKIREAGRVTSAASSDPITVSDFGENFVDGAIGANNPVYEDGVPLLTPFKGELIGIGKILLAIATETEKTADRFSRDKSQLNDTGRYYRFNVLRGLEEIALEDSKQKSAIIAATDRYIESQAVFKQMKTCANSMSGREC